MGIVTYVIYFLKGANICTFCLISVHALYHLTQKWTVNPDEYIN
jgi:hypothetical protein